MKVQKHKVNILSFVRTTILYKYIKSLSNDFHNLSDNTHVRIKIYGEFYHGIVYIAHEGCNIRITYKNPSNVRLQITLIIIN
jgi:hypothetical protein